MQEVFALLISDFTARREERQARGLPWVTRMRVPHREMGLTG